MGVLDKGTLIPLGVAVGGMLLAWDMGRKTERNISALDLLEVRMIARIEKVEGRVQGLERSIDGLADSVDALADAVVKSNEEAKEDRWRRIEQGAFAEDLEKQNVDIGLKVPRIPPR